jgi:hypothetical protein
LVILRTASASSRPPHTSRMQDTTYDICARAGAHGSGKAACGRQLLTNEVARPSLALLSWGSLASQDRQLLHAQLSSPLFQPHQQLKLDRQGARGLGDQAS